MLYLTSDGFADQNNPAREKMGSKKVNEILSQMATEAVNEQKRLLEEALDNHQQGSEQRGDITFVGIRI